MQKGARSAVTSKDSRVGWRDRRYHAAVARRNERRCNQVSACVPMSFYQHVARPLLFRLSPDRSHALAQAALRVTAPWRAAAALGRWRLDDARLRVRFAGIDLPNPIGLAAGFDKNCELMAALACFGFGFVTVGSIMPQPRYANPFPPLLRYAE